MLARGGCEPSCARPSADFEARRFERGQAAARAARTGSGPAAGEVEYLLGVCEKIENHPEAALAAWAPCPARRARSRVAALAQRVRSRSRSAATPLAETCLERAGRAGKNIGLEAGELLGRLNWITGRHDEYSRLPAQRRSSASGTLPRRLRTLWSIDTVAYPIDAMRLAVGEGHAAAPDDDRVWLAWPTWRPARGGSTRPPTG